MATPDEFRCVEDGEDDAPSINRAIKALSETDGGVLSFRSRLYIIRSPIKQTDSRIEWRGRGWAETAPEPAAGARSSGTWLLVDRIGFDPITISGQGSRGSIVSDIGFIEKQPLPVANQVWKPSPYPYLITLSNTVGMVEFNHVMLMAVTNGIRAYLSGRLVIDGLYGQVFDNALFVDKSFDAGTYLNIHLWPYWSQAFPVMSYTQSHLDGIWLDRADTGIIDNLFVFAARSGVRLGQSPSEGQSISGGSATKNTIETIHCDATRWCLWITGLNVHFQASNIDSQSQAWMPSGIPPAALKDAAAIRIEGQAVIQIGRIWQEFTDHSTISYLNPTQASNLQVGSLFEDFSYADPRPAHATMRTASQGQDILWLAMPPMVVSRRDQTVSSGQDGSNGIVHSP